MTNYKAFDIVLVPFPFTNLETTKQRPALVLSHISSDAHDDLYICTMITSQIQGDLLTGDCILQDWQKSGLLHPSKLRLAKVVTLEQRLIHKKLGQISSGDKKIVKTAFKKIFHSLI